MIRDITPPNSLLKSGGLNERIAAFSEWEKTNSDYIVDIALLEKLTPEAVGERIPHLTGQEWMLYTIESMLAAVRHHHKEFMQKTLDEATTKESK